MKKSVYYLFMVIIILMMSGCKSDGQTESSDVKQETAEETDSTSEDGAGSEADVEDTEDTEAAETAVGTDEAAEHTLLQGLEGWEDTEAVRALNQVLRMNATVKITAAPTMKEASGEYQDSYLNDITHFLDYQFEQKMQPDQYSIIDLDQDGTPEAVVSLQVNYDGWILVMRYYEGNVYGYSYQLRGFELPKADGTYLASSGAADNSILGLSFDGYDIKEHALAYSTTANGEAEYFIADKKVPENEFRDYFADYYNKEDVKWSLFPSSVRAGYEGEELFHVDFPAIVKPVGKDLERYSSVRKIDGAFTYTSKIPQELCDLILEAMKSGTEEETFQPLIVSTEVSQEEYCEQTGFKLGETEAVYPVTVDADNDGMTDLVGQYYGGGTGGFSSMELYQGMESGGYQLTSSMDCFLQNYDFIAYQGKNYLLMKEINYNTKYDSGYSLYLYEDGILADGKLFSFEIEDYQMEIANEASSFQGIEQIKNTLCNKKLAEILENNDGVIYGNAETIDKNDSSGYAYSSDIDNDGVSEKYYKYMWYPSNMGTFMVCSYDFEDSNVLEDLCARLADQVGEGRLYTFWIDQVEGKNIMYLYFGNNMDFSLYAYLLTGKE